MCGIAGLLNLKNLPAPDPSLIIRMLDSIAYRGPDEARIYRDNYIGLGCARLSIVDPLMGKQPMSNEDGTVWVVLNGEIFNHGELRERLLAKGHRFVSHSDSEVLAHLYEADGPDLFRHLNGQFAFAIWDSRTRTILIGRDRFGICPLFYTLSAGRLLFASEIKGVFADSSIGRELDLQGLDQILTFWTTVGAKTTFKNVSSLPPAHYLQANAQGVSIFKYWEFATPTAEVEAKALGPRETDNSIEGLRDLLERSVSLRTRGDAPVGAYMSGGLDSSTISQIASQQHGTLKTYSIRFKDPACDEHIYQQVMSSALKSDHHEIEITESEIASTFPEVVWHAESPLIRTAPVPLFLLSSAVKRSGLKVVLTGEGADELLLGYDLYKAVRATRRAKSGNTMENDLLRDILDRDPFYHPENERLAFTHPRELFSKWLPLCEGFWGVHEARWRNMSRVKRHYSEDVRRELSKYEPRDDLNACLPKDFLSMPEASRAQILDYSTLLGGYLLSSQGDRMSMGNSVEQRFPFLDHNIAEYLSTIPSSLKIHKEDEKYLLKKAMAPTLPKEITQRRKMSYTAPGLRSFFKRRPSYFDHLLSKEAIVSAGYFDSTSVSNLIQQTENNLSPGSDYYSALVPILSTQILHNLFVSRSKSFFPDYGSSVGDRVSVIDRAG